MTRNNPVLRISLLASMVATALAAPAAFAGAPLETRPVATAAPAAEHGARLIVRYRDANAARASKLQTVDGAAHRAHAARLVRNAADARTPAPSARYLRKLALGADLLRLSHEVGKAELAALVRELSADPAVRSVEVDRMMQHTGLMPRARRADLAQPQLNVDDEYYAQYQWHLHNAVGGIDAPAAWDASTGAGVVVAVLDTGIVPHPDMDANMLEGYDFITDPFVSRRATDARVPGAYDYGDWEAADDCEAGRPASDSSFHGTHVAGTVAESSNNGIGMAGVAHNAQVLPVRVLGRCGGYTSDIADAIVWAAGGEVPGVPANPNPAEVINMSLGGGGSCSAISQAAINQATALGATVVVAAGNSNSEVANFSPASCDNVVSVAAGRITGGRASYSNYGALIDLTGPGGGGGVDGNPGGYVWQASNTSATSPDLGDPTYVGMGGTSMASPHVAGVVALVQSAVVGAGAAPKTPAEIEAILVDSARAFPATPDRPIGSGLLDADGAIALALGDDDGGGDGDDEATPLTNKVALRNLSGTAGESALYSIEVPAGARLFNLMSYGGRGNISVYVSAGEAPTAEAYEHKSTRPGNNETVRLRSPAAATYYIRVVGESDFSGLTLQARVD
ncbi:MAG: S8 family peptidase [Lysobacter sp.]